MFKKLFATIGLLALTACGTTYIDAADSVTTAVAISQGFTEMNPVIGAVGDSAAPVVALVMKEGLREFLKSQGYSECEANKYVGTSSALGVGNNIAVLAGASGPVGLAAGALAAVVYYNSHNCAVVYYDVALDPETGEIEFLGVVEDVDSPFSEVK